MEAPAAPSGYVRACHTSQHFKQVARAVSERKGYLDADTTVSPRSTDAALRAAGGACLGVDAVMRGEVRNAFVPARPPGHHATGEHSMGFCLFNSRLRLVALSSTTPRWSGWQLLIGTCITATARRNLLRRSFRLLLLNSSIPLVSGNGARGETGIGRGRNTTLNVPVRAKTPAREHVRMYDAAVEEISVNLKPDLILISAGFDAHESDPLGQLRLQDDDYVGMTRTIINWAQATCAGRIVSCLEGGYNLGTLGGSVRAHVKALCADSAN
ncbi:MAG: histone deacetylase [Pyrinomonadaceae bacterium]